MSAEGITAAPGDFNGFVFETASTHQVITGISLVSTNIPGLTAADLSFSAHTVSVDESGLTQPSTTPGSIVLAASFGAVSIPSGPLLNSLNLDQQLELIYIAYYNRAADGGGFAFRGGQNATAQAGGQGAAQALTNIANSFAPQAETDALYPILANPKSRSVEPRCPGRPRQFYW